MIRQEPRRRPRGIFPRRGERSVVIFVLFHTGDDDGVHVAGGEQETGERRRLRRRQRCRNVQNDVRARSRLGSRQHHRISDAVLHVAEALAEQENIGARVLRVEHRRRT